MIRCAWCGAKNYAIDMWCARCSQHLDWAPPRGRRRRVIGVLAPLAAAIGVTLAFALPAASWFSGRHESPAPVLPRTAPVSSPTAQALSTAPTEPSAAPLATPTDTPPDSPSPTPTPAPALPPAILAAPNQGIPDIGDPAAAVSRFYAAVSAHDFDAAASLWTARMQAQYPPAIYIDQRFSATKRIDVTSERVLSAGGTTALIYVDLTEVIGSETRHWVGTWQVVRVTSNWLLNSPNLRAA